MNAVQNESYTIDLLSFLMADVEFKLDLTSLNRAMALAENWSNSFPSFLVARTAQRIVRKTRKYTPFVTVDEIDEELDVAYAPGKTRKGKLSVAKKHRIPIPGMASNLYRHDEPLAYLIQLARMSPGSVYNIRTHNRWMLPGGFQRLKGLDSAGRATVLQGLARRMTMARHSSTHFLVSGWASAAKKIYNLLGFYLRGAAEDAAAPLEDGFSGKSVSPKPNMSFVTFSNSAGSAMVMVSNMIGTSGSVNAENYNKALVKYGTNPLQRAIDEVAVKMTEHYWPKEQREMASAFNAIR